MKNQCINLGVLKWDVKNNEYWIKLEFELGSTEREQDDSILERTDTPEDKREKEVDTVSE